MDEESAIAQHVVTSAQKKQPNIVEHFQKVLQQHDLSHAYLFNGEDGSGKMAVALMVSMALFCPNVKDGIPCGKCNECRRIATHQHPDVVMIEPDGNNIKIDQVRFLKSEFSKSAVEGSQKVFIIDEVERMTTEAANSLLKFIEEPTGKIVSFLLTDNKLTILPTIISRTQVIDLPSLTPALFNQELKSIDISANQFNLIATMTNNLNVAKEWNQDNWFSNLQNAVSTWFSKLASGEYQAFVMVQTNLMPLINNHDQQKIAINMIIQVWRDVLNVRFKQISQPELNFPNNYQEIKHLANHFTSNQLLSIMNLLLENNIYLEHHVNFQNILEASTLQILTIIRKK